MLYTNRDVRINFPGEVVVTREWLDADPDRAQRVLRRYHGERPVCSCVPGGVLMHIVSRQGVYYLASMPGRGHHHSLSCPYYIPHPGTDALRYYADAALSRASGLLRLQVHHGGLHAPPFPHFSPRAGLECLWEFAGLNVHLPDADPAPGLSVSAHALARISADVRINGQVFLPHVPPVPRPQGRLSHVVGLVRYCSRARYGYRLVFAGDIERNSYWINDETWQRCELASVPGLVAEPVVPRYMVLARLWRSPHGFWNLFDVGVMEVDERFLPVRDATRHAVDRLAQQGRCFFVCARLDADRFSTLPVAVLLDADVPTPIFSGEALPRRAAVRLQ